MNREIRKIEGHFEAIANKMIEKINIDICDSEKDFLKIFKEGMSRFIDEGIADNNLLLQKRLDVSKEEVHQVTDDLKKRLFELLNKKIKTMRKEKIFDMMRKNI